ncbi:TetR/AcrR family transcriptional regulator [Sphingobium sp. Sx8-8]|uniref:TetR/AcrR family transcriptional regulator n=1 Tax=Sphingobium sp. Sx8-8 TaxID=2933617 RepID=UPI001F5AB52B|nr:TetR/AcrR family transcriptional regulator [Sphingobium sp. Sx8-8]
MAAGVKGRLAVRSGDDADPILDAAVQVVRAHGIDGATIDRIAEAAGLSRATLYRRFSSRDAIIADVLRREAAPYVREARAVSESAESFSAGIIAGFVFTIEAMPRYPIVESVFVRQLSDNNARMLQPVFRELVGQGLGNLLAVRTGCDPFTGSDRDELFDWLARTFLNIAARAPWNRAELERHVATFVLPVLDARYSQVVAERKDDILVRLAQVEAAAQALAGQCAEIRRLIGGHHSPQG